MKSVSRYRYCFMNNDCMDELAQLKFSTNGYFSGDQTESCRLHSIYKSKAQKVDQGL